MDQKKVLFLTSILIFVFFGFLFNLYLKESFQRVKYEPMPFPILEKKEPTLRLPLKRLTQKKEIDEILYENISAILGPRFLNEEELANLDLVNLVHIKKEKNGEFAIECEFGPLYENSGLELFYPEELISLGRIKECSLIVAEVIDKIAKTPKRDCRLPLLNPIPENLNDYYLVTLASEVKVLTPEKAKQLSRLLPGCEDRFFELIGKKISHGNAVWILDLKEKILYP